MVEIVEYDWLVECSLNEMYQKGKANNPSIMGMGYNSRSTAEKQIGRSALNRIGSNDCIE
jgi:hypothetical protein